jgi:hypothetical protein
MAQNSPQIIILSGNPLNAAIFAVLPYSSILKSPSSNQPNSLPSPKSPPKPSRSSTIPKSPTSPTSASTDSPEPPSSSRSRSVRCAESIADFACEYSGSGKHLSDGVQLEYRPKPSSRLKVAISRLKQDLAKANVAPPDTLFTTDSCSERLRQRDGYAPTFELGITIYLVKQGKKPRK